MDYPTMCCEVEPKVEPKTEISPMDLSVKVSGLCEDIKAIVGNTGTDSQVMGKAEEIIHLIRLKNNGWEHLWDAPDGSYKGRCRKCGFVTVFTEGHDTQYRYCPSCGEQKKPYRMKD